MSPSRVVERILGVRLLFSDTFFTSFLGLRAPLRPKGLLSGILRKSCNIPGSNLEHLGPSLGPLRALVWAPKLTPSWAQKGPFTGAQETST